MGVVVGLSPIVVSAEEESERQNPTISISNPPSKDKSGIKNLCSDANARIHDKGIWKSSGSSSSYFNYKTEDGTTKSKSKDGYSNINGTSSTDFLTYNWDKSASLINIEINMIEYRKLSEKNKQTVMQQALNAVTNAENVSRTNKNKIYNDICALDESTSALVRQLSDDVNADFNTAYGYFKPFSGVIGTLLGGISLAIFVLLGLTIVIDLAYITIPALQLALGKTEEKNGGKPKFISIEAIDAVKEAESKAGQEYTNPVSKYFHSKTKQMIAIAICLVYLVSGNIYNLIGSIIDYFNLAINI